MPNRASAFKTIIRHLSCEHFQTSIEDIYDNYVSPICPNLTYSLFYAAFRYSKFFGFIEKCGNRDWHIKSVDDMCERLRDLDDDAYIGVRELNHPISLAFGIIIHDFNDQTVPTTEIETRIETEIENYQGELSQYKSENVVSHTLRFLNHFSFANELGDGDWHIKSVDDMCERLRGLDDNHNIGIEGGITAAQGIRAAGIHAGIKAADTKDMTLIVTDTPAAAAGVFTKNSVTAAPVILCREHLSDGQAQAVIVNSGNANACTGEVGMTNARRMASATAEQLDIDAELVLVSSTGVIGQQLPMDKIENGIQTAAEALSTEGGNDAAEGIMTTDTHPKSIAIEIEIDDEPVRIGGIAKGSGMIAPNMATMLSYLTTDARINAKTLQTALNRVVDDTYNLLTVDTDRSTNDTVIILATGCAENADIVEANGENYETFCEGLQFVCTELVKMLARDGEGATKLVEVVVKRAKNREDAEKAARAVAESPLVKTAIFANDANWGRIMMAIGKSGAEFDPYQVDVWLADYQLVKDGMDSGYDEDKATALFAEDPVRITIDLCAGDTKITMWTCDYSYDYIRINADYRT